jgi:small subunit ribosomal protein S27Ae
MSEKWKIYEVEGDKITRRKQSCPRCGEGIFMAEHSDRLSCGACGYTVWKEK